VRPSATSRKSCATVGLPKECAKAETGATQAQRQARMGTTPSRCEKDSLPVETLPFDDAVPSCKKTHGGDAACVPATQGAAMGGPMPQQSDGGAVRYTRPPRLVRRQPREYDARGGREEGKRIRSRRPARTSARVALEPVRPRRARGRVRSRSRGVRLGAFPGALERIVRFWCDELPVRPRRLARRAPVRLAP